MFEGEVACLTALMLGVDAHLCNGRGMVNLGARLRAKHLEGLCVAR
jgi:hypothetical protein